MHHLDDTGGSSGRASNPSQQGGSNPASTGGFNTASSGTASGQHSNRDVSNISNSSAYASGAGSGSIFGSGNLSSIGGSTSLPLSNLCTDTTTSSHQQQYSSSSPTTQFNTVTSSSGGLAVGPNSLPVSGTNINNVTSSGGIVVSSAAVSSSGGAGTPATPSGSYKSTAPTAIPSSLLTGIGSYPSTGYDTGESVLPREFRTRLHKLFTHIEREYEREYRKLAAENIALQERLMKYEDADHGESNFLSKKLGASQISQRIKLQYKQSTSRLVSSLRPTPSSGTGGWQLGCRFLGHRDGVWEVTTHRKLVGSASADGTVRLWANATGSCLLQYQGHTGSVNSVRFRDDLMLTASGDGTAHLIRIPAEIMSLTGMSSANAPSSIQSTGLPGSTTVASSGNSGVSAPCGGMGTPGQDQSSLSGFGGGGIPGSGQTGGGETGGQTGDGLSCGISNGDIGLIEDFYNVGETDAFPDESVTVLRSPLSVFEHTMVSPFHVGQQQPMTKHGIQYQLDTASLSAADFLGSDQMVTGSWDRLGRIYDLGSGQEIDTLTGHDHQLTDVRCASGGQKLALTSSKDGTFRLWDFRKSGPQVHVQQGHSQTVCTAQFVDPLHPEKLVSGGTDRVCKIWDMRQLRAPLVTIRVDASVNRLAVHPSGQVLALPLDNRNVKFFDLQGNRLGRLPRSSSQGHSRMVTSVGWSDEGKNNFFSAGFDHQVLGWQIQFPMSN